MTVYQELSVVRVVILGALGALFIAMAAGRVPAQRRRPLIALLVMAAALSYPNFGYLHNHGDRYRHLHLWDTFHYFMGAKYLPELGYVHLYEATLVAGRELGAFGDVREVRDLTTYRRRDAGSIDAAAVVARFSPTRWAAFKRDLGFFLAHLRRWPQPLVDHGYNDPTPRAWLLHVIVRDVPATPTSLTILTSLDYLVVLAAFAVVATAFGREAAALAFAFLALNVFARFDFVGGTLLRWDWIAALLVAVSALARGAGLTAGLFLGYSIAARVFPAVFLLPLVVKWGQARLRGSSDPTITRTLVAALGVVIAVVAAVAGWPETRSLLLDWVAKIGLHAQTIALNSIGLRSLVFFNTVTWSVNPDGSAYLVEGAAGHPAAWLGPLASGLYALATLPLVLRVRPVESLMYAVPLIFCSLTLTGYYYAFLVLLVLLPWQASTAPAISLVEMGLLTLTMATAETFTLTARDMLTAFNAASIQLAIFFTLWVGFEYVRVRMQPAG